MRMPHLTTPSLVVHTSLVLLCTVCGMLILEHNPLFALGLVALLGVLAALWVWPELATGLVFFAVYANLPVIATRFHGIPQMVAGSVVLLLAVPIVHALMIGKERVIVDHTFLLMFAFLVVLFASSCFARDTHIAVEWILTFLQEGIVLYWLILNAVRTLATLRRVIGVLLLAGSLLGALSLYQEMTQSYDSRFGGLAQRGVEQGTDTRSAHGEPRVRTQADRDEIERARGPVEESNRYAQILLVLLPLALFRFWGERSPSTRRYAAAAAILILGGIVLTYSRGAFVTLMLILLMLMGMRYLRPAQILTALAALILTMALVAPGYFTRMNTLRGVTGLMADKQTVKPDGAIRGRATEMLAALLVFRDHPVLGVGPGQYAPFYSREYHLNPAIAFRHLPRPRPAHSLYFQMAAETGVIGLAIFMAIVLVPMYQLWQARRHWARSRPDLANMATALLLSLVAYLGTGIFLHLAYQRYYWLLLAVVGAALQIFQREGQASRTYDPVVEDTVSRPERLFSRQGGLPL